MTRVLVVGVGHPDRGDDAAGWLVADRLGERLADVTGVEVVRASADPASLLMLPAWDGADHLVLVDAVVTGAPPGTVVVRQGSDQLPRPAASGTHDLGVAGALQLADALGRLPPEVTIVGIEGARFGLGDLPSPAVVAAAMRVAADLEGALRRADGRVTGVPG